MQEDLKEVALLRNQIKDKQLPPSISEYVNVLLERVERASRYGNYSTEYESISKYIYWVMALPWGSYTVDNLDMQNALQSMDKNHYGMSTIKERILEFIAVMNLQKSRNENMHTHTPIICFVGLQGIGKTTMARSIAGALGRSFERISLGGMPSALELLGHSKANPDAEPGQIVKALIKAKTMNPVILLDEVEKCGNDLGSRASVMASLLEILDPEQNVSFMDNYIGFPIDLSQVSFILTANNLGPVSSALLDRLEIIKLTGYSDEEKEEIARHYLLPKVYEDTGLKSEQLTFADDVWHNVIRPLGYEAGIRELERVLMGVGRKSAKQVLEDPSRTIHVTKDNLTEYISPGQ